MDPDYIEKEIKILNIDVDTLITKLEEIKAKKVFDDERTITYLDNDEERLKNMGSVLKITDEGTIKVSLSTQIDTDETEQIKFKASRRKEAIDLLGRLGFKPKAELKGRRISFELEGIDIDIDVFPEIPPFVEIDLGINETPLEDFLKTLQIVDKERVTMSTPDVYEKYKKNFFELFKKY